MNCEPPWAAAKALMSTWQSAQALAVPTSPSNFQNVLTYRWPCPIGRRQQSHRCGFLAVLSVWFQTSQGSRSSSHISVLEVRRAPDRDLGVVGPGGGRLRRLGPVLLTPRFGDKAMDLIWNDPGTDGDTTQRRRLTSPTPTCMMPATSDSLRN